MSAQTRDKREEDFGLYHLLQDGHMISIAVHPHHRRKGIGKELLQRAMKIPLLRSFGQR